MKRADKKQVPLLKLNEGTLKGGFKLLDDLQKIKIKAGKVNRGLLCINIRCH